MKIAGNLIRIAMILWLGGYALAQAPVLETEHFELVLAPGAEITDRHTAGAETRLTVLHDGHRVRVHWRDHQALFLFPTSTMRVRVTPDGSGEAVSLNFNAEKYVIKKSRREIAWLLGEGEEIFFQTRGGRVAKVIGPADYLRLGRQTNWGRMSLISGVGVTDAMLNGEGQLETFDGPDIFEHLYLVKGFALQAGPITVRFPLPKDPFLNGLPDDRFLMVKKEVERPVQPAARTAPEKERDPLQAEPASWGSPELKAKFNEPNEDPLAAKRERRVKYDSDPLKAKTAKDSEELLRVKDY